MSVDTVLANLVTAAKGVNEVRGLGKIRGFDHYPDSFSCPAFIIADWNIEYDQSFGRGTDKINVTGLMAVARANERSARKALSTYVPALKAQIELDRTLAGAAQTLRVASMNGYRPLTSDTTEFRLAAVLSVEVYAQLT